MQKIQNRSEQEYIMQKDTNKTIVIVEDDDNIGSLLLETFSLETSYNTMLVTNSYEAIQLVHHVKPCLFITDYCLPGMNGIQLYDYLHNTENLDGVPVIVMSAQLPMQEVQQRHLTGLSKPFDIDYLLGLTDKLIQAHSR